MTAKPRTAAAAKTAATPAVDPAPMATDLSSLAAGLKTAAALPAISRRGSTDNPFEAQVKRTFEEGIALETVPLPNADVVKAVRNAIIRAVNALKLSVSIRTTETEAGTVLTFQAKAKVLRKAKDDA